MEKLVVCSSIIQRKINIKNVDELMEKKKDHVVNGLYISAQEQACI